MNNRLITICLLIWGSLCFLGALRLGKEMLQSHSLFGSWLRESKREYGSAFEYIYRLSVFHANRMKVEKHNSENHSYTMRINDFADLTADEFMARYTSKTPMTISPFTADAGTSTSESNLVKIGDLKPEIDWVKEGKVAPIRNQGRCGSCYSFASVAAMESAYAIAFGELHEFSEQFYVNCGSELSPLSLNGCSGGFMIPVFQIAKDYGVFNATEVPYEQAERKCDLSVAPFAKVKGYDVISPSTMVNLLAQVMKGPVAVSIEVTPVFHLYDKGVLRNAAPSGFFKNHAVTVVGYNLQAEIPYLLIRNSWGILWGDWGYFRLPIGDLNTSGTGGVVDSTASRPFFA